MRERGPAGQTHQTRRALAALLSALLFVGLAGWLSMRFLGQIGTADWDGYRGMYMNMGDYLARQGRDPLFVGLINLAGDVFGAQGYERFRSWVVVAFAASGLAILYRSVWAGSDPLAALLAILAAYLLKSMVQIREGFAFLLIVTTILAAYRGSRKGMIVSGIGAAVALLVHAGMVVFVATWMGAVSLIIGRRPALADRRLPVVLAGTAILAGLVIAWWAQARVGLLARELQDFGMDTRTPLTADVAKYVYWAAIGLMVLIVSRELRHVARDGPLFSSAYATFLGTFILPATYTVCVSLIFIKFEMAAIASLFIRVLLTTIELGLLIVVSTGRARWPVTVAAAFLIAIEVRVAMA